MAGFRLGCPLVCARLYQHDGISMEAGCLGALVAAWHAPTRVLLGAGQAGVAAQLERCSFLAGMFTSTTPTITGQLQKN